MKRCSNVNENLLTTKPRICTSGKKGKIIYPPTLTFFWRRQVNTAALKECDAHNSELHLLMQIWEVTIVSRKTIALAGSVVAAKVTYYSFLVHVIFMRRSFQSSCYGVDGRSWRTTRTAEQEGAVPKNLPENSTAWLGCPVEWINAWTQHVSVCPLTDTGKAACHCFEMLGPFF